MIDDNDDGSSAVASGVTRRSGRISGPVGDVASDAALLAHGILGQLGTNQALASVLGRQARYITGLRLTFAYAAHRAMTPEESAAVEALLPPGAWIIEDLLISAGCRRLTIAIESERPQVRTTSWG